MITKTKREPMKVKPKQLILVPGRESDIPSPKPLHVTVKKKKDPERSVSVRKGMAFDFEK